MKINIFVCLGGSVVIYNLNFVLIRAHQVELTDWINNSDDFVPYNPSFALDDELLSKYT